MILRTAKLAIPGLVCAVVVSAPSSAQNLLNNGSFDTNVDGWTIPASTVTTTFRGDLGSTLTGGSGPGCMEVSHDSNTGGTNGPFQQVAVTAGTTYTLSVGFRVPSADNPAVSVWVDLAWVDEFGITISWYDSLYDSISTRDAWFGMSGSTTAPAGAVGARVFLRVGAPSDDLETRASVALFDDVSLVQVTGNEVTQELYVPAGAAVHGQQSTYWSTDGWFSNLTDTTVSISGSFLRQGQDNSAAVASPTVLGSVSPEGFVKLDDLVSMLGVSEAAGGICLVASATGIGLPSELVKATTHTYTPNPYGDGVYGQGIPAVSAGTLGTAIVPGVFQGSELRTNVGALNTSSSSISLKVTVLNAAGNEEASTTWTLQPYEQRQVALPSLGISSLSGGTVKFELQGSGSFRGYTSTVDQSSGDAVYNEAR